MQRKRNQETSVWGDRTVLQSETQLEKKRLFHEEEQRGALVGEGALSRRESVRCI